MKTQNNKIKKETRKILERYNFYQLLTLINLSKGEKIMKTSKILTVLFIAVQALFINMNVFAQEDLNSVLAGMNLDSAKQYSQVLTNAMSSNINSGMFLISKPGNKFSVYFGVKASGTFLSDKERSQSSLKNVPVVPLAMAQLSVGSVLGTDAFFRFLPSISIGNYASINSWGVGIQHNLAKDFKKMTVDVIFRFSYHKLQVNDSKDKELVNMNSWAQGLIIGKRVSIITFYAGFQYEKTNSNIKYTETQTGTNIVNFSLENDNNFRAAAGFNLKAGLFNINADYNFGKQNSVSVGLGFGV
jgi:hypothetical protein